VELDGFFSELDNGCAPTGCPRIKTEIFNQGMFFQNRVDPVSKDTLPFAVDNLYFENPGLNTGIDIVVKQIRYLTGIKGVQIKGPVDRELDGIIGGVVHDDYFVIVFMLKENRSGAKCI
jgi:hypothetical protein